MVIETILHRGFNINIYQDEDASNPRSEWDNAGIMVCCHSRYDLGDVHPEDQSEYDDHFASLLSGQVKNPSSDNYDQFLDKGLDWIIDTLERRYGFVVLPLYLYDHSGLTMSTSSFSCPWDSGQVGHIYASGQKISEEWNGDQDAARKYLIGEVNTYDHFLTGSVYGYNVEAVAQNNPIECDASCWGFYGDSEESGLLEDAKIAIDNVISDSSCDGAELNTWWIPNEVR